MSAINANSIETAQSSLATVNEISSDISESPVTSSMTNVSPPLNFTWSTHCGSEIKDIMDKTYDEIIHWRPNLFITPQGSTGNSFVQELARLFQAFADGSSMECVCMKAVTILQALVLQKPSPISKNRQDISHMKWRLDLWKDGKIFLEGKKIKKK